jgi:hypothetical protein
MSSAIQAWGAPATAAMAIEPAAPSPAPPKRLLSGGRRCVFLVHQAARHSGHRAGQSRMPAERLWRTPFHAGEQARWSRLFFDRVRSSAGVPCRFPKPLISCEGVDGPQRSGRQPFAAWVGFRPGCPLLTNPRVAPTCHPSDKPGLRTPAERWAAGCASFVQAKPAARRWSRTANRRESAARFCSHHSAPVTTVSVPRLRWWSACSGFTGGLQRWLRLGGPPHRPQRAVEVQLAGLRLADPFDGLWDREIRPMLEVSKDPTRPLSQNTALGIRKWYAGQDHRASPRPGLS